MSEYFIPGVGIVRAGSAFKLPSGRQFNGAWLAGAKPDDLAALGAVPVNRAPRPIVDERTHRVIEHQDGPDITYTVEALDPAEIASAIAQRENAAIEAIDTSAEQVRLRFVTPGSAQAMAYQAKIEEAARWAAAGHPVDLTGFPLIAAEIGISGESAAAVTALWTQMEAQWRQVAAQIEAVRLGAKAAVSAAAQASDFDGIQAAMEAALTALSQIGP